MDIPGERSSHTLPTPRGGGIAIAVATILAALGINHFAPLNAIPLMLIVLPALMAILGALDDFMSLGIKPRLIVQFALASAGVFFCVYESGNNQAPEIFVIGALAIIALVWQSNLYNFMDGINGIAATQAICVSLIMGTALYQISHDMAILKFLIIIGFASAGFLYWNFPKAKIFMGDAGSLFLGFAFGLIAVKTGIDSIKITIAWLISMAVFIVDASYTLGIRFFSGQKFYFPHRSHSYQKLALRLNSHAKTTLLVSAVNLIWLFPITLLMASNFLNPFVALGLAYSPLVIIAAKLKAGSAN